MKYAILLLTTTLLFACGSKKEKTEDVQETEYDHEYVEKSDHLSSELQSLHDELIQIHDEVMPELSSIKKYKIEIKHLIETDSTEELGNTYVMLHEADSSMIQWMRNHHEQHLNYTEEKNKRILEQMKADIITVRDRMLNSIKEAKRILKED